MEYFIIGVLVGGVTVQLVVMLYQYIMTRRWRRREIEIWREQAEIFRRECRDASEQ